VSNQANELNNQFALSTYEFDLNELPVPLYQSNFSNSVDGNGIDADIRFLSNRIVSLMGKEVGQQFDIRADLELSYDEKGYLNRVRFQHLKALEGFPIENEGKFREMLFTLAKAYRGVSLDQRNISYSILQMNLKFPASGPEKIDNKVNASTPENILLNIVGGVLGKVLNAYH